MSFPAAETQRKQVIQSIHPCQKFKAHIRTVDGIIHLPDRQRIMTCSLDGSLRVWNLETGEQIGNDWRDGESAVGGIALSLNGKNLVSGSGDGAMKIWDMDTRKVITKWTGHRGGVNSVSWSRDGARIMSGSFDGTARVWDVESGKTILEIDTGLSYISTCGAIYSPDETMIATGGGNEEKEFLKIWDAKTGKLVKNLKGHTWDVTCLAWTPDGSTLISCSVDCSIRTWNTTTGQQIAILTEHTNIVLAIAISPNGRIFASASADSTARLWELENGHLIGSPLQHPDPVYCLSFSTDGKLLTTGCGTGNVYLWDTSAIDDGLDELLDFNMFILNPYLTGLRAFAKGKRKNISGAEIRLEREKARNAKKKKKKTSAGSSRPPQNNVTHQSSGAAQIQLTSQLSSSSVTPAIAAASASTALTSPRPLGRWTRFRLYICCLSGQYTDGHE